MKKILLITATSLAISSTALADSENMFYIKGQVGGQMLNKASDKRTAIKLKSKFSPFVALGVGYNPMENVRVDLAISHYFEPTMKKTAAATAGGPAGAVKHKGEISALTVNAYVDVFDASVAKFFLGGGVGMAQIKEKISWQNFNPAYVPDAASSRKKNNPAYRVTVGASTELSAGVNGEVAYSWEDFGKTKSNIKSTGAEISKTAYKGHHVHVGIRFEL